MDPLNTFIDIIFLILVYVIFYLIWSLIKLSFRSTLSLINKFVVYINNRIDFAEDLKFAILLLPFLLSVVFFVPLEKPRAEITHHNVGISAHTRYVRILENYTYKIYEPLDNVSISIGYRPDSRLKAIKNIVLFCYKNSESIRHVIKSTDNRKLLTCVGPFDPGDEVVLTTMYAIDNPYDVYNDSKKFFSWTNDHFSFPVKNTSIFIANVESFITMPPVEWKYKHNLTFFTSAYPYIVGFSYPYAPYYKILALIGPDDGIGTSFYDFQETWKEAYNNANIQNFLYTFVKFLIEHPKLNLILVVSILIYLYVKYGREAYEPSIETLHHVPQHIKPWMVNYRYVDKVGQIDGNGIVATLLDWANKGYVELVGDKVKLVNLPPNKELDRFERAFKRYLKFFSEDGIFSEEIVSKKIKKMSESEISRASSIINSVWNFKDYYWKRRALFTLGTTVLTILGLLGLFSAYLIFELDSTILDVTKLIFFYGGIGTYLLILSHSDSLVFNKMKPRELRKYYQWQAFKRLLEDYSLIDKYGPKDKEMWGEWLVYATALGVADNMLKYLNKFKVADIRYDDEQILIVKRTDEKILDWYNLITKKLNKKDRNKKLDT